MNKRRRYKAKQRRAERYATARRISVLKEVATTGFGWFWLLPKEAALGLFNPSAESAAAAERALSYPS